MPTLTTEAERLLAKLDRQWLTDAALDIEHAMRDRWGLTLQRSTSMRARGHGGECDGMSISEAGIVVYRPTGNRRSRFTLAHELAHILVEGDVDTLTWLSQQSDMDRVLEQLCDVIAARLLIPRRSVDAALAGRPVNAAALARLHGLAEASWSACAIALATRLPCDGFVAITARLSHKVVFAARARDTYPYAWRGDTVPTGHPIRTISSDTTLHAWWPRFNINERRPYYLDAEVNGSWIHTVFAENDLWHVEKLHLPDSDQEDRRHDGQISCPSCGYQGRTSLFPCSTCQSPTCQRCDKCDCDRNNDRPRTMCEDCTNFVLPHLVENGLCPSCR